MMRMMILIEKEKIEGNCLTKDWEKLSDNQKIKWLGDNDLLDEYGG